MKHEILTSYSYKALYQAVENNNLDTVSYLLAMKCATSEDLGIALRYACTKNNTQIVQLLIDAGANFNYESALGTPLTEAVYEQNIEIVRILIEAGADTSIPEYGEVCPPLTIGAEKGNLEIVNLLVEAGADVNQIAQSSGDYALISAAGAGYEDIFNYLLPLTNPELRTEAEKILPLGIRDRQREENVDPLVKKLSDAVFHGSLDEVKAVLKKNPDINGFNEYGCTAIFWAVSVASLEALSKVRLLLEAGANPNLADEDSNETPLMRAMNDDICSLLIKAGADVNAQTGGGETALMITSGIWGGLAKMEVLISAGADVNIKDEDGKTALMYAARQYQDNFAQVKLLIESGADIKTRDIEGNSALSFAKEYKNNEVIQFLLEAGATEE